jgi:serine/threonine protein phosphatase PrpC
MHLLAVFDGHSSSTVSTMAAEQLPGLLTQLLLQEAATAADIDALMPRLLHEAFQQLDDAIKPLDNAGSTASVAVITPQRVHLGWVGDSRAVLLGRGGHVLGFTQEHRATREDEQVSEARGCCLAQHQHAHGFHACIVSAGSLQ